MNLKSNLETLAFEAKALSANLQAAHRVACGSNQLAELLLMDLIGDAVKLGNQLARIRDALKAT